MLAALRDTRAGRLAAALGYKTAVWATDLATRGLPSYSRLFLLPDAPNWVLNEEMRELADIAAALGICLGNRRLVHGARRQSVFYASQFALLGERWLEIPRRVAVAYFHGLPGTGEPAFDAAYERIRRHHGHIHRVQTSHAQIRDVVLGTGIAPHKVFLIPIGINLEFFKPRNRASRLAARRKYSIPESAVVVGSFQKDGVGWAEGMIPKLIKGPDVFVRTIELLKSRVPELLVLLSGPARGYVKAGLERLGVPYRHCYLKDYQEIGELFHSLDLYIVASRQEGGPKAILEAMACGVPLVTTRVGQAMDLVRHGENAWMVEVEDTEGLAHYAEQALAHPDSLAPMLEQGRRTAEANAYPAQIPLWRAFMDGFVNRAPSPP